MKNVRVNFEGWIQLLGMVGVLGGLVFVGLEMRQSQLIAVAGQQQARANMYVNRYLTFIEAGLDYYNVNVGSAFTDLSTEQQSARRNNLWITWVIYENDYYQYEAGLMTEENWEANLENIRRGYNQCDNRDIYEFYSQFFEDGFRKIIEAFPNECLDDR